MKILKELKYCPRCGSKKFIFSEPNRYDCRDCGFVFYLNPGPTVGGIFVKDGKILLSRRAFEPFKNLWDTPGGFINSGETAREALKREMKEEMGIEIEIGDYLGDFPDTYGELESPTLNFYFSIISWQGEMKVADDIVELKWFSLAEIPFSEVSFENSRKILKEVQEKFKK